MGLLDAVDRTAGVGQVVENENAAGIVGKVNPIVLIDDKRETYMALLEFGDTAFKIVGC